MRPSNARYAIMRLSYSTLWCGVSHRKHAPAPYLLLTLVSVPLAATRQHTESGIPPLVFENWPVHAGTDQNSCSTTAQQLSIGALLIRACNFVRTETFPNEAVILSRRSRHQLSYQQAQDIADGRPPPEFSGAEVADLRAMLDLLVHVTDAWRARRVEVGLCGASSGLPEVAAVQGGCRV